MYLCDWCIVTKPFVCHVQNFGKFWPEYIVDQSHEETLINFHNPIDLLFKAESTGHGIPSTVFCHILQLAILPFLLSCHFICFAIQLTTQNHIKKL